MWAPLKRGLYGVWHKASRKHLHRYIDEATLLLNEGSCKVTVVRVRVTMHIRRARSQRSVSIRLVGNAIYTKIVQCRRHSSPMWLSCECAETPLEGVMQRSLFLAAPLMAVILLTGCGSLHSNEPIIEDYISAGWSVGWKREIGTMASDASRRLTVVRLKKSENAEWKVGEFCSEPPPDAMVAIREQLTAEIKKGLKNDNDSEKRAKLASLIASSMGPLMHRSQGLQWHRDNMAYICMAYMNRIIENKAQYRKLMKKSMMFSRKLIEEEIKKGTPPITINVGNLPAPAGEPQSD